MFGSLVVWNTVEVWVNTIYEVKIKLNRVHGNTVHITWEYYLWFSDSHIPALAMPNYKHQMVSCSLQGKTTLYTHLSLLDSVSHDPIQYICLHVDTNTVTWNSQEKTHQSSRHWMKLGWKNSTSTHSLFWLCIITTHKFSKLSGINKPVAVKQHLSKWGGDGSTLSGLRSHA